jgi:hypothetical protein
MQQADPEALPTWWLLAAAGSCVACIVLFGVALALDSVALSFFAVLMLLIAATGLPWVLSRHRRKLEAQEAGKGVA